MYFKIRRDAQKWFENIEGKGPFNTAFDFYYLCALIGVASGRSDSPQNGWSKGAKDLIDNFPGDYKPSRSMIIGLLISAELRRIGIGTDDKEEVKSKLDEIIDTESRSKLSDRGVQRLNEYASGGYKELLERLNRKPQSPEDFLLNFMDEIESIIEKNELWQDPQLTETVSG